MKNLTKQIEQDARYLQTLFGTGKFDLTIYYRYMANLELLYAMDCDFQNPINAVNN